MDRPLILGRYRPLGTSGEGASGTVEVAWDTRIQRRVAIKRIPLGDDLAAVNATLAEARTSAMLSHPSIVSVLDFEIEGSEALIIMEYVDGVTLADILDAADKPLDPDVVAAILRPVSEALAYAHENQVLHLDIKPENILIGRNGIVKVSDFGLASLSGAQGFSAARGGTIGYMPPEQIDGAPVDARTDEWALASVVYEMLTLENPFVAPNLDRAFELAQYADIAEPSAIRDDVSPAVDAILLDALSPEPDVRLGSVEAFEAALTPYLGSPRRGKALLRELANPPEEVDEEPAGAAPLRSSGLWDRIPPVAYAALIRAICAAASAWIAWAGLTATPLEAMPSYIIIGAVAATAAIVPQLGGVLAYIVAGVGAIAGGSTLAGGIAIACALVWWASAARLSNAACAVTLGSVFAGIAHLPGLAALIAGFILPPKRALPAALFAGVLILACAPLTGSTWIYALGPVPRVPNEVVGLGGAYMTLLKSPRTWIIIGGWALSALAMSALCTRGTRFAALLGCAAGGGIMTLCQLSAQRVAAGGVWSLPQLAPTLSILASFILMGTICVLGSPLQTGGAEEPPEQYVQTGFR